MTYVTSGCEGEVTVVEEAEGQVMAVMMMMMRMMMMMMKMMMMMMLQWTGQVVITAGEEAMQGWSLQLVFSAPLDYLGGVVISNTRHH